MRNVVCVSNDETVDVWLPFFDRESVRCYLQRIGVSIGDVRVQNFDNGITIFALTSIEGKRFQFIGQSSEYVIDNYR